MIELAYGFFVVALIVLAVCTVYAFVVLIRFLFVRQYFCGLWVRTVPPTAWHHLGFQKKGRELYVYFDGREIMKGRIP